MAITRRMMLGALCAASLTASLVGASGAAATTLAKPLQENGCGANPADYSGTFSGLFEQSPGDTLTVTFTAPTTVHTDWTVEGWTGSGSGDYEITPSGVQWIDSDVTHGPITGVDSEVYRSVYVSCAADTSEVETINGVVDAGNAQIPFTVTRQS